MMRILLGGIRESDSEIVEALPNNVVAVYALTSDELLESVFDCAPDLLLVASGMPGIGETLRRISAMLPVPVVMIAGHAQAEDPHPAITATDLYGYLTRPIAAAGMGQTLQIACAQFKRLQELRAEVAQLQDAFACRKIIDRAKGVIMQRRQSSENEAYALLREESRRQRIPIVEVAKMLLDGVEGSAAGKKAVSPAGSTPARQSAALSGVRAVHG